MSGFEPAIPASGRPQTLALDRSAIGISKAILVKVKVSLYKPEVALGFPGG